MGASERERRGGDREMRIGRRRERGGDEGREGGEGREEQLAVVYLCHFNEVLIYLHSLFDLWAVNDLFYHPE